MRKQRGPLSTERRFRDHGFSSTITESAEQSQLSETGVERGGSAGSSSQRARARARGHAGASMSVMVISSGRSRTCGEKQTGTSPTGNCALACVGGCVFTWLPHRPDQAPRQGTAPTHHRHRPTGPQRHTRREARPSNSRPRKSPAHRRADMTNRERRNAPPFYMTPNWDLRSMDRSLGSAQL